ncbi:MAG: hypothetical protein V1790_17715 [Planctomycetota bacterium]
MTDRERLRWECQRHLDRRPITGRESGPAAWLAILVGLALAVAVLWGLGRLAPLIPPSLVLGGFSLAGLVAAGWLWLRLR